jgi:hypothetical protein
VARAGGFSKANAAPSGRTHAVERDLLLPGYTLRSRSEPRGRPVGGAAGAAGWSLGAVPSAGGRAGKVMAGAAGAGETGPRLAGRVSGGGRIAPPDETPTRVAGDSIPPP